MGKIKKLLDRLEASHSYGFVMVFVVITILLAVALPEDSPWRLTLVISQVITALLACWTSEAPRRLFRIILILSVLGVLSATGLIAAGASNSSGARALNVAGVLLIIGVIIRGVGIDIRAQGVRGRAVAGALTIYLLFGTLCGFVYGLESSLGSSAVFAGTTVDGSGDGTYADHMYFSFVTLTTVGYGDLTPASGAARATAIFEALVGQLYLVAVVATLGGALGKGKRTIKQEPEAEAGSSPPSKSSS